MHVWYMAIEQMADSIEGAVLKMAEKSDHLIHSHQPELIIEAIKEVMDKSLERSERYSNPQAIFSSCKYFTLKPMLFFQN